MTQKGKFIVLEGINGAGKGTHGERLEKILKSHNIEVYLTKEPYENDENGKKAIEMLKSDGDPYSNNNEAVMYFAKNRDAHNKMFVPLLNDGIYVLSDRYWYSNFAYQHAQGIDYYRIAELNTGLKIPDLTIFLDVEVEEASKRIIKRDREKTHKFSKDNDFMKKVRANYLELPKILPDLMHDNSIRIIDGMGTIDEIWERIYDCFKKEGILTT